MSTAFPRSLVRPRGHARFVAFAIVGGSGYAVNLGVFSAATAAGAPDAVAAVAGFCVAVCTNFALNRAWTFHDARGPVARQYARFATVALAGLAIDLATLEGLLALGVSGVAAQAVGIAAAVPVTFAGNRLWSFAAPLTRPEEPLPPPLPGLRTLVCVPTYNESATLPLLVGELLAVLGPDDRILVVDDASPDGTGELAERLGPNVEVLHRSRKEGLGRAYVAAFRYALARGARYVVQMDADLSHRPSDVPRLVAACADADLAIGSRYVPGGSPGGLTSARRVLSAAGAAYARVLLGLRVRDLTGGFKCFRRSALAALPLDDVYSRGYAFQIETTYRLARSGFSVAEVPIDFQERTAGTSKLSAGVVLEALLRVPLLPLDVLAAQARATGRLQAWRGIAFAWLGSRLVVLGAAALAAGGSPLRTLHAWDGRWYGMVARHGYFLLPGYQSDAAFFPLYPVVLRALGHLGLSTTVAGPLVSNTSFLLALLVFYELARTWFAAADARRAAIYAAYFPLGFVFSMVYPEALSLLVLAGAGLAAARCRWKTAAVLAALGALGRPEAAFLVLPFAAAVVRRWRGLGTRARTEALAAIGAAPAALAGLMAYDAHTLHDPVAFSAAQLAWGRRFSATGVLRAWHELSVAAQRHNPWLYRDAAFLVVYLVFLVLARRLRVPWPWIAAATLTLVLPLESGSVTSVARFGLLCPPVYCGLAYLGRRPGVDVALRVSCASLLAAGAATVPLHWP
ncbi:MAG TPA: glycosyltransferase [Gaiellaceae bacterium]|nr:glycosyltransferase [Gaiellaceae bacterium]